MAEDHPVFHIPRKIIRSEHSTTFNPGFLARPIYSEQVEATELGLHSTRCVSMALVE